MFAVAKDMIHQITLGAGWEATEISQYPAGRGVVVAVRLLALIPRKESN